jgi:hypothetical protein
MEQTEEQTQPTMGALWVSQPAWALYKIFQWGNGDCK